MRSAALRGVETPLYEGNEPCPSLAAFEWRERERETFITELGEGRKTTLKGELKLRKAKATTLGIVLHARSCAMGGGDVVGEVKGVEEVGV